MSYLLNRHDVDIAFQLAKTAFLKALDLQVVNNPYLYFVLVDPASTPFKDKFASSILFEDAIGEPPQEVIGFARAKAEQAWEFKQNTRVVTQELPHLLSRGDIIYGGGVYMFDVAAGASGVQSQYDQLFCEWVICGCRAVSVTKMRIAVENKVSFIGINSKK